MNQKISKLINKYCAVLAMGRADNYKGSLKKVVKKTWNNTPWNERNALRKRMNRVIEDYEKQLEKPNV